MLLQPRTVIYHVNDLAKAKEWYFNLTNVQPYFDEAFYVGFNINGFELGLDPDLDNIDTGNHTVTFWSIADINYSVEKAVAIGATIFAPICNVGGSIETAIVTDPFGNNIGFICGT
jgi:predicted enzyme related to lactoylglutathione lyase